MALDHEARMLLDQMEAAGAPPLHEQSVEQARALIANLASLSGETEAVESVEDRTIPGPAGNIPVRIYRSVMGTDLPALVWLHGGGFVIGSIDTADGTCRSLANRTGCVVVSVEYRLAPEHPFPAAADDAYAATVWVAEHAADLGIDAARLGVAGDSAGGNLAAVTALMARDRGGPPLAFQLLIYPVTDAGLDTPSYLDNAEGFLLTRESMRWFWNHYTAGDTTVGEDPYASPLRCADLSGLPPALIVTAEFDPLRDEGEAYGRRLADAGVSTTVKRYDGMIHGFFAMNTLLTQAKQAVEDVSAAVRAALSR